MEHHQRLIDSETKQLALFSNIDQQLQAGA
jgi:hypothetical protein